MNDEAKALFKSLRGTAQGERLSKYIDSLIAKACDSRTWSEGEDRTHANKVADFLSNNFLAHLKERKMNENSEDDEYE